MDTVFLYSLMRIVHLSITLYDKTAISNVDA